MNKFIIMVLCLTFIGCGSGDSNPTKEIIPEIEVETPLPQSEWDKMKWDEGVWG